LIIESGDNTEDIVIAAIENYFNRDLIKIGNIARWKSALEQKIVDVQRQLDQFKCEYTDPTLDSGLIQRETNRRNCLDVSPIREIDLLDFPL
jgi:hypothetical protein